MKQPETLRPVLQRVSSFARLGLKPWFCLSPQLTQITRTGQCTWESKNILAVSFAPLAQQSRADGDKPDTVHLRELSASECVCVCLCVCDWA